MTTPYYEDDAVTLYHGDALEVAEWLVADAMVSDVPYGIAYRSNKASAMARSIDGDADTATRDAALTLWGERPALVFGSWQRPRPTGTRMLLVWDTKGALGMGDTSLPWKPSHQEIYVLGKGFTGRRTTDVLTCAPVQSFQKNGRYHPHEKPVTLMGELIRKCPPGVIADPFAGSGSTLLAAKIEGRRAIGVEINEGHCEIAAKRLSAAPDTLFGGVA